MQIVDDMARTLNLNVEGRIQARIPCTQPMMAWIIDHASMILTKCHRGSDGKTAYERLHGEPARDRLAELGEVVFFFVPKRLRHKMSPRWRVGVFLGRSWNSDQNIIGLLDGTTTRARAMVRTVESRRWSRERIQRLATTPIDEKPTRLDTIEDHHAPQSNPEPHRTSTTPSIPIRALREQR